MLTRSLRLVPAALLAALLAGCLGFGGGQPGGAGLAPALTARMDVPNARLDSAGALELVNAYRATQGATPVRHDAGLDGTAQALASQYASTGRPPQTPAGLSAMRLSAGYSTFANTFSGWRNSPQDAAVLATRGATRAGLASAYNAASEHGIYWVLVLAP